MTDHVFALAGLPGCGKSTAAEIIKDELEFRGRDCVTTEVSDFVRTKYESQMGESTDDNSLGAWAAEIKDEEGQGYFVREMAETLLNADKHVVISGLRSPEEAEAVRDVFGEDNVTVLAIWTLPDIRFERKYGEIPSEEHPEWDTFQERNERETYEWGCVEYFLEDGCADHIISNNSSETALNADLSTLIEAIPFDNGLPTRWDESYYPFPESDREVVGQYL